MTTVSILARHGGDGYVRKKLLCGISALVLAGTMSPVAAQTSSEILMRRPLPGQRTPDVQTGTPTPGPGAGTPTPTPGTVTPVPGEPDLKTDPDLVDPGSDPGPGSYVYQWVVGEWQGQSQCGQSSTMTRTVSCQATGISYGSDSPMVLSSYGMSTPAGEMAPAVFDPSSSDVRMALAQFGGGGGGKTYTVPPQYCIDSVGPHPDTTYVGTGAGCGYTPSVDRDTPSEWHLPDGAPGSATCSADAFREFPYTCTRDSDGVTVSNRYCLENIGAGGARSTDLPPREYGNYSSCTAQWKTKRQDLGCHAENDPYGAYGSGPIHYVNQQTSCVRSDGSTMYGIEAAACGPESDRPFDGVVAFGSCSAQVSYPGGRKDRCMADSGGLIKLKAIQIGNRDVPGVDELAIAKACYDAGAKCVGSRSPASNYAGNGFQVNYSGIEIICTSDEPVREPAGYPYYPDSCDSAHDAGSGCPLFASNGLYGRYWSPDQQVPPDEDMPSGGGGGGDSES
jgi:hypothetical protein